MHVRAKKIRHLAAIHGAVGVAGLLLTTLTSASSTTSRTAATTAAFALRGSIAGGIKTVQADQTLTFVFTEINQTTVSVPEDLVITKVTNVRVVAGIPCVLPGGVAVNSDGNACEPGLPHQRTRRCHRAVQDAIGQDRLTSATMEGGCGG